MLVLGLLFIASSIIFFFSFRASRLLSLLYGFSAFLFLAQFFTEQQMLAVAAGFVVGMIPDLGIVSMQEEELISRYVRDKKIPWWLPWS